MILHYALLVLLLMIPILVDGQRMRALVRHGGLCSDSNPSCSGWAAAGECQRNSAYMHAHCRRSCNLCPAEVNNGGRSTDQVPGSHAQSFECNDNSHCGNHKFCDKRKKCVDLCHTITCGKNARCQVSNKRPKCFCPGNTQGDPGVSCQTVQGCNSNTHCESNKICENARCINPCELINCGRGARCQTSGRDPQCICPQNTQGDPRVQCQPIPVAAEWSPWSSWSECSASCGKGQQQRRRICTSGGQSSNTAACTGPPTEIRNCSKGQCPRNECTGDAKCTVDKVCRSGTCVNPCNMAKCGQGAICQVIHRRPQCMCPGNTKVNQGVQCQPRQDNDEPRHPPNNIGDRAVAGTPAPNNQAPLQITKPPSSHPIRVQGQQSTRQAGCYSIPDPGGCRGAFPRFYYNQENDQCDCFLFGGCDEEKVKFTWLTFEECLSNCVPSNKAKGPGCQRATLEEVMLFLGK